MAKEKGETWKEIPIDGVVGLLSLPLLTQYVHHFPDLGRKRRREMRGDACVLVPDSSFPLLWNGNASPKWEGWILCMSRLAFPLYRLHPSPSLLAISLPSPSYCISFSPSLLFALIINQSPCPFFCNFLFPNWLLGILIDQSEANWSHFALYPGPIWFSSERWISSRGFSHRSSRCLTG